MRDLRVLENRNRAFLFDVWAGKWDTAWAELIEVHISS